MFTWKSALFVHYSHEKMHLVYNIHMEKCILCTLFTYKSALFVHYSHEKVHLLYTIHMEKCILCTLFKWKSAHKLLKMHNPSSKCKLKGRALG